MTEQHLQRPEKPLQPGSQSRRVRQFAFPKDQDPPTETLQLQKDGRVALLGSGELRRPKLGASRRKRLSSPANMAVPKTAVNEDRFFASGKNQIRLARQAVRVQPITITQRPSQAANDALGLGVAALHLGHQGGSTLGRKLVHPRRTREKIATVRS